MPQKTRIISLRLSEPEFESLKARYAVYGAKSISEFARSAMHRVISVQPKDAALEVRVQQMDDKLRILDAEVARIAALIEADPVARFGGGHAKK